MTMHHAGRWTLRAAVAAALAVGAAQALATPREAEAAPRCDPVRCDEQCKRGGPNLVGRCLGDICQCYVMVPL